MATNKIKCGKETEIALIDQKLDRLIRLVEGNGKRGVISEFYSFKTWTIVALAGVASEKLFWVIKAFIT